MSENWPLRKDITVWEFKKKRCTGKSKAVLTIIFALVVVLTISNIWLYMHARAC